MGTLQLQSQTVAARAGTELSNVQKRGMQMRPRIQKAWWMLILATGWLPQPAPAQEPFTAIPFESLPDGTLVQGAGGISLDGNAGVTQNLTVAGTIESLTGGFVFPDGTVQSTAAKAVEGESANAGLYDNRIVAMVPLQPYSEICFKSGQVFGDIHVVSESPAGGACVPGDRGFLVERNQRTGANWEDARLACLLSEMRLPEAFEWLIACNNAGTYGLNSMTGDWEWASNSAYPISSVNGIAVNAAGLTGCNTGSWGFAGNSSNSANTFSFRCVR